MKVIHETHAHCKHCRIFTKNKIQLYWHLISGKYESSGILDKKVLFQTRLYNGQKEFLFSMMTAIYNGGYGCNPDFGRWSFQKS